MENKSSCICNFKKLNYQKLKSYIKHIADYRQGEGAVSMTTILVLENEITTRSFITLNMKRSGFNVLETDTGEKALELLENHNVDIVILDVMLPGIDGFQVCKRIRKQ